VTRSEVTRSEVTRSEVTCDEVARGGLEPEPGEKPGVAIPVFKVNNGAKHIVLKNLLFALVSLPAGFTNAGLPPERGVKTVKVVEVPGYSEGVVVDAEGAIYLSDVYQGVIYRVGREDGAARVWATTGAPNGHKILADGTHLVCDGSQHAVLHLDAAGQILGKAASAYEGKPLRAPNDLTLDGQGGFYFTDPGGSNAENPIGAIYYVDARGRVQLVADGLAFPNGIALRPGGKTLLVGESKHNRILSYDVVAPGKAARMRVFANLPAKRGEQIANEPDGICLDAVGNLYVAHYGMRQVQVLSPGGKLLRRYAAGNLTTSNVAFGGARLDQLYVTGALGDEKTTRGALFRLDLRGVKGLKILRK
jgi:gluconolactonase